MGWGRDLGGDQHRGGFVVVSSDDLIGKSRFVGHRSEITECGLGIESTLIGFWTQVYHGRTIGAYLWISSGSQITNQAGGHLVPIRI